MIFSTLKGCLERQVGHQKYEIFLLICEKAFRPFDDVFYFENNLLKGCKDAKMVIKGENQLQGVYVSSYHNMVGNLFPKTVNSPQVLLVGAVRQ